MNFFAKPPPKAPPPRPSTPPPARPPGAAASVAAPPPPAAPAARLPFASRPASPALPPLEGRDMPAVMASMMEAIRLYDALLSEENEMLQSGNSKGVATLLDRKMAATRLYQERLRAVLTDGECTRALTADQRAAVVARVKSLEELAKENTVLLKANMSAIEQLFEVINTAARKSRRREVAYSQAGRIRDTYSPQSVSLAYNHTV